MNYSVHFCLNGEELFQVYSAPIPRVGDYVTTTTDTTDNAFVVSSVHYKWIMGRAGKPSLYVVVELDEGGSS
jgi:hypothetical protein